MLVIDASGYCSENTLGLQLSFIVAHLELRYSCAPFSKRFPSCPVTHQSSMAPEVGPSTGSRIYFPDRGPVYERPVERYRITGSFPADKRLHELSEGLPTPKRWTMLILPGNRGMRWVQHPTLFDIGASNARDVLPQGKAS